MLRTVLLLLAVGVVALAALLLLLLLLCVCACRRRPRPSRAYRSGSETARWLHAQVPARDAVWFNFGDWSVPLDSFAQQCEAFVDLLLAAPLADEARVPLRVLDVGCGASGAQSAYVARRIGARRLHSMLAIDPALDAAAHTHGGAVQLLPLAFEQLPAEHGAFNTILAVDSLYHVDLPRADLFAALAARFDAAAPRCWLAVTDLLALPAPRGQTLWSAAWRRAARALFARLFRAPNLTRELTPAQYAAVLERQRFTNVRVAVVTDVVLAPFAAHVDEQLARMDGILAPATALKFRVFAALLRFALRHSLFEYVRVTAEWRPPRPQ